MRLLVFGNPENRRIAMLGRAAATSGVVLNVVSYASILRHSVDWQAMAQSADWFRIESPGGSFEVERLLLARGAEEAENQGDAFLGADDSLQLQEELGRIRYPWQFWLGFRSLLNEMGRQMNGCRWMNTPAAVACMFDKLETNQLWSRSGVPIAPQWGRVQSFDQLYQRLHHQKNTRLFLKLVSGSSASGAIALWKHGDQWRAVTTVERVRVGSEFHLYNSLRLSSLNDVREIAELVDALAPHRIFAETWIPKAAYTHRTTFDLRAVVIDGNLTYVVPRVSSSPMTNLHLRNQRGELEYVSSKLGDRHERLAEICSHAASSIEGCYYTGLDVVVHPNFREFTVLEANAFGDLLPGWLDAQGRDTYLAEMQSMCSRSVQ